MVASLANPTRHTVIAISDGEAIGWAKTHYWSYDDAPTPAGHYLGGVTVHPEWRRHGVGAALTAARMEWIWDRAADAWYIVNVRNRASIELHRRWGFEEVARAPAFHTTSFTGGIGLLMRAQRANPKGFGSRTPKLRKGADNARALAVPSPTHGARRLIPW